MTGRKRSGREAPPDVSVLIAAWRAEGDLPHSVANALAQEGVTVEVIVVDDASDDGTFALAEAMAGRESRVRAIRLPQNVGPAGARNVGLVQAQGKWIAVLDSDDRMVPRRLQRMVALAETQDADIVLGNLAEVDEAGAPLADQPFITEPATPVRITPAGFVSGNLRVVGANTLGYLKPLIRRSFLESEGIGYNPDLRNGEDYHLILAALLAGAEVWFSPDPDYLYTRRPGSVSARSAVEDLNALIRAETDLLIHPALTPELRDLMEKRRRALRDLRTTQTVLHALKDRHLTLAREALAARPRAAGLVLRQLSEAALRRLVRTYAP